MPSQVITSIENNFTKGLITEATGLNFPENAATDASNCEFTLIGDVTRRLGYDLETNGVLNTVSGNSKALCDYVWNNPGGQSNKSIMVKQIGSSLYFYDISASTLSSPLSTRILPNTIDMTSFAVPSALFDPTIECEFAQGNGYLFVYQESCQPFYCTYSNGAIAASTISIQIRDLAGAFETVPVGSRPTTLSDPHFYNLQNQGWTQGNPWSATSGTPYTLGTTGNVTFNIQPSLTVAGGTTVVIYYTGSDNFSIKNGQGASAGTVVSYSAVSGALVVNITTIITLGFSQTFSSWSIIPNSTGNVNTFQSAAGVYPSNADVWWYFKDNTGAFNPASTLNNVSLATGNAPQGHFVLNAFTQNRNQYINSISTILTLKRPTTGAWWQGRVWYTGVNDSFAATSNTSFYNWNGNIYYSTVIQSPADFGVCYQTNDPTSENLNGELPTDGGIISIPESGTVHKLFPIQNGMLVFANNGIWFITGSQGIGFASNDYTITKISSIRTFSSKSFIDVMGLPYFWNEEGIYEVSSNTNGQLTVNPITVGTILTYYNSIPVQSKRYARGDYNPIDYVIQWVFRSTEETGISDRYQMDTILNYNVYNKAFFPYTVSTEATNSPYITDVKYVTYPVISTSTPLPTFKYSFSTNNNSQFSFAEESNTSYVDWGYLGGSNYTSTFTTGYKVHGKGLFKFNIPYVTVFNRTDEDYTAYYIQGLWDYAATSDSNRWTTKQFVEILDSNMNMVARRHRIRGRGLTLQIRFTSVDGQPFDIMGWAVYENINTGV